MPAADATGRRSLHVQIALELHESIQAGEYGPGARLPGENELARDRGVSTGTARKALALLVSWGAAATRRGSGVYVRDVRPVIREGIQHQGSDGWQAGRSMWAEAEGRNLGMDQIEVGLAEPPAHVRDILGLRVDGMAIKRSRRYLIDGQPVALSCSWLSADLAAGTPMAEPDTGPGGIYARLRDQGHEPVRFREDLRARMPLPGESERLERSSGTPVLVVVRTAYDQAWTPIEVNEMIADSDAYIFRYEFDA